MTSSQRPLSAALAASAGLAALVAAIGIGRFAFTPLFPLMQEHFGISLGEGAWLASANYLGYLVGSVAYFILNPDAGRSARWGLLVVAASTLAMGGTDSMSWWFALRLVAGIASAFVLVGVSAWALAQLTSHKRPELSGFVFAGVGLGICLAGLLTLMAAAYGLGPAEAWIGLGVVAAGVVLVAWRPLACEAQVESTRESLRPLPLDRSAWILVACYGAFGFGYIIPATFIPAVARSLVNDPRVFGWAWPLFGLAAAISTIIVAAVFRLVAPRKVAGWSLVVMAAGVFAPILHMSLASLAISAVCVGGTFMVMTMAGVQEARRLAHGAPTKLVSAMTGAFAIGQFAGPILVSAGKSPAQALIAPSILAVALLLVSAGVLLLQRAASPSSASAV